MGVVERVVVEVPVNVLVVLALVLVVVAVAAVAVVVLVEVVAVAVVLMTVGNRQHSASTGHFTHADSQIFLKTAQRSSM